MIALTWRDVSTLTLEVNVMRSSVRNRFDDTKTECFHGVRCRSIYRCSPHFWN